MELVFVKEDLSHSLFLKLKKKEKKKKRRGFIQVIIKLSI
jgi:hypothetical protein